MEFISEAFLLNFSLLAITFSAVSALVMLLRQTMGGKLSNFDIFLVNAYVAHGFVLAIAAILPVLAAQYSSSHMIVWTISGLSAGVLMSAKTANTMRQRRRIAPSPMPRGMQLTFALQWLGVAMFFISVLVGPRWNQAVFDTALTLCLATIMWAFVRRISSLLGEKPHEDWDPSRG